ncbi:MAG TPA: protein translocase subunit SecD [Bacillota bacterium]
MGQNQRSLVYLLIFLVIVAGFGVYLGKFNPVLKQVRLGLDLQGGMEVVIDAVDTPDHPVTAEDMVKLEKVINNRVNGLGVTEPTIYRSGNKRMVVQLPGIKDYEQALDVIGRTAYLEFYDQANMDKLTKNDPTAKPVLTGTDLQKTDAVILSTGENVVTLEFKADGAKKFAQATKDNIGKPIYILLDKQVIQSPNVIEEIPDGKAQITGYKTLNDAQNISVMLNAGAIPVKIAVGRPMVVSAALGQDSLAKSKTAGLIGAAAVVAFMVIFYLGSGAVASFALALYAGLTILVLWGMHATLTLHGIAGFILSVGMAVDANIITYERIKDELRNGRTMRSAIDAGYNNAMRTIIDSNVTTLIAGGVLFFFGSGTVRGFAVTLSIGVLMSMFTAVVLSRFIIKNMVGAGLIKDPRWFFGMWGGAPLAS